jgi:hypothetical protein
MTTDFVGSDAFDRVGYYLYVDMSVAGGGNTTVGRARCNYHRWTLTGDLRDL